MSAHVEAPPNGVGFTVFAVAPPHTGPTQTPDATQDAGSTAVPNAKDIPQ